MIGNKLFEILKEYKLTDLRTAEEHIKSLKKSDILQIAKCIESASTTIEESKKIFDKSTFNVLINKHVSVDNTSDLGKMLLYVDKIAIYNQFGFISSGLEPGINLDFVKKQFVTYHLPILLSLKPLIENEILYLVKPTAFFNKFGGWIESSSEKDITNEDYKKELISETNVGTLTSNSDALKLSVGKKMALIAPMKIEPGKTATFSFTVGEPTTPKPLSFIDGNLQAKNMLNQIYGNIAKELNSDLLLSNCLSAHYVTKTALDWRLLHIKLSGIDEKRLKVVPSIMELDLKFLENLSYAELIKIRRNVGTVFDDFKVSLKQTCENINEIPNTVEFKSKVDKIKSELIDPQLRVLDREIASIQKQRLTRMCTISTASVAATVLSGGGLIPSVMASAGLIKEYADWNRDANKLKNNPMYFLWKLKDAS